MSDNRRHQELIEKADAALRLAQEDARQLARETGTEFIAGEAEQSAATYPASEARITPVVRDNAEESE